MYKKTLVVASANAGKIKEIQSLLPDFKVVGYGDFFCEEIEETGETFYENAKIKAEYVAKRLNVSALADDSGLCVEALGGAPGVYSARYSPEGSDDDNIALLLKNMQGVKNRKAKFVCCMVYFTPKGEEYSVTGETEGEILTERRGKGGFGYDPVFYSYDLKKAFGECLPAEKNSVSHRGRALKKMAEHIKWKI